MKPKYSLFVEGLITFWSGCLLVGLYSSGRAEIWSFRELLIFQIGLCENIEAICILTFQAIYCLYRIPTDTVGR